jgi:hypothetical protein
MPSSAPHKLSPPQDSPFKGTPLIKYAVLLSGNEVPASPVAPPVIGTGAAGG